MEGVAELLLIAIMILIAPSFVAAIFWLLLHIFPKGQVQTQEGMFVRTVSDIVLIITLQLLYLFFADGFSTLRHLLPKVLGNVETRDRVALILIAILLIASPPIYNINKWVYSFPRWKRIIIHFPLSILIALAIFVVMLITFNWLSSF